MVRISNNLNRENWHRGLFYIGQNNPARKFRVEEHIPYILKIIPPNQPSLNTARTRIMNLILTLPK